MSASGYYAWRKRLSDAPCLKRKRLADLVRNCFFENRRRYGARRISKSLAKTGENVGRSKVRALMSEENLKAFKPKTTDSKQTNAAPNLPAEIDIEEAAPAKIIIGDITYIRLRGGKFCYLAIWQDKVTRRIIGWSLEMEMTQELVISALLKAIRKGLVKAGAIIHSDRGSQYASNEFRRLLQHHCFRQSMSGKGNCYDNAQRDQFLFPVQSRTDGKRSL